MGDELFQVRAQLERTLSAKLDEMLNFQKATFNKSQVLSFSLSFCSTSSSDLNNVVFISSTSNVKLEKIEPKIENVSEIRHDKGKSILGAPPKVVKETIQNNHRSTNKKSQSKKPHFHHHCGASDTLVQIVINGLSLNKAIVCHLSEAKINFKILWLLLGNS